MNKIIFCADDFGLSSNTNRSIIELIQKEKLKATSIMADKNYLNDIKQLSNIKNIQLGLHFYLTTKPFFTDSNIKLNKPINVYQFINKENINKIINEFKSQLFFIEDTLGKPVDYIDSHHYILAFPYISDIVFDNLSNALSNYVIKLPFCLNNRGFKHYSLSLFSKRIKNKYSHLNYLDGMLGIHNFNLDLEKLFNEEVSSLANKDSLICHYSTHPCKDPSDLRGIDSLTEFRKEDYNFLNSINFKIYNNCIIN